MSYTFVCMHIMSFTLNLGIYLLVQEQLIEGWRSLEGGLIHKALQEPSKAAHQQALLRLMSQALGLGGGTEGKSYDLQDLQEMEVSWPMFPGSVTLLTVSW